MNPLVKVFIGLVLLVLPLALYVNEFMKQGMNAFNGTGLLGSLWLVIRGTVPPFVALIGLFIVWLELDEWRIEKELKAEEEKAKKKEKKKE
ncbi:MAG: hypothetical protein J4428_04830 [Candidatus Aenigmarchaeota archaeon]|nr:hypothetical protein [Candidatus Aenigmarchaeota archaeon]